jgi:hypothetical protein
LVPASSCTPTSICRRTIIAEERDQHGDLRFRSIQSSQATVSNLSLPRTRSPNTNSRSAQ